MEIILGVFKESLQLLNEMSAYLILGFFVAGVIHVFLKEGTISKHLGASDFRSVVKASLLGIPLPLCSCGVVPTALSLKKEGASKGAIISFLVSTPITGIDSIFVTYSLLGGIFAIYRIFAAFIIATFAGIAVNIFDKKSFDKKSSKEDSSCACCHDVNDNEHGGMHEKNTLSLKNKIIHIFSYGFGDLLKDSGLWIIGGIFIGGMISYFVPDSFIEKYLSSLWFSMLVMMLVGIPMYVCSTGSVPIAAALMLKGLNPGAAFVFLLTGPASNTASLTVLIKELGLKAVAILLITLASGSFIMGFILNYIWSAFNIDFVKHFMHNDHILPYSIKVLASIILVLSIAINTMQQKIIKHKH